MISSNLQRGSLYHEPMIIPSEGRSRIPHMRPYRYPYSQKNEIEKIIEEMLTS